MMLISGCLEFFPQFVAVGPEASLIPLAFIVIVGMVNEIWRGPMQAGGPWYTAEGSSTAIAVLPLENLSGDESQDFLSAGLHSELITTLSRITQVDSGRNWAFSGGAAMK